jgi:hypothetical protein
VEWYEQAHATTNNNVTVDIESNPMLFVVHWLSYHWYFALSSVSTDGDSHLFIYFCLVVAGKCGLNDLHTLDVDTMEWSVHTHTPAHGAVPSTRNNHATFVYGSKLYVHGGHDGLKWLADLHCLDTLDNKMEWTQPTVSGAFGIMPHCTTMLDRSL